MRSALSQNPLYSHRVVFDPGTIDVSDQFAYVGVCEAPGGACHHSHPPDDWPAVVSALPALAAYHKPDRNPTLERSITLDLYASQRFAETPESQHYLNQAQAEMMSQVPRTRPPSWFFAGLPNPVDVLHAIMAMNPTAHAGYPYCHWGLPKREFCLVHFPDLYELVCLRILCLQHLGPRCHTPQQYYDDFCADPVLVMIKNEMIKIGKRPRIIAITSTLSEVIERLVSDDVSYVDKADWGEFYSCIGIGFSAGDADRLLLPFRDHIVASSDVPAFDVTRTEFEEVLDLELLMYQIFQTPAHPMFGVYLEHCVSTCRSLFVFSDGVVWAQRIPGTTKTGRKLTSKFNTQSRARRSIAVSLRIGCASLVRCAGDDSIETHHPDKPSVYAALGFPLKDYSVCEGYVEFCSHQFVEGRRPVGVRIAKSAANLLYRPVLDVERLSAFIREYADHPELPGYLSSILALRPRIKDIKKTPKPIQNSAGGNDETPHAPPVYRTPAQGRFYTPEGSPRPLSQARQEGRPTKTGPDDESRQREHGSGGNGVF